MTGPRWKGIVHRAGARLMSEIARRENQCGPSYVTLHRRPKRAIDVGIWSDPIVSSLRAAVVMQGPIAIQDDFSLETLKLYASQMPNVRLILSTWNDTDPELLDAFSKLGVTILLNEKPAIPGLFNVNMQIVSASAGVRAAVDAGVDWILKTRTDQRLYAPNIMSFLVALAQSFPVAEGTAQSHRIVGLGHGSLKFAPYHVTDQTIFGSASDMLSYWTPPLRTSWGRQGWPDRLLEIFCEVPIGELCRYGAAETYLASQFLERIGRKLEWTIEDSWEVYRDHFCFADLDTTGLFWQKIRAAYPDEGGAQYSALSNRAEIGFCDWLLLHSGILQPADGRRYNKGLENCFHSPVLS